MEDSDSCDNPMMEMDCCDDETEFYQAELDLIKQEKTAISYTLYVLPFEFPYDAEQFNASTISVQINDRGPPLNRRPLYISLSRLTYYG